MTDPQRLLSLLAEIQVRLDMLHAEIEGLQAEGSDASALGDESSPEIPDFPHAREDDPDWSGDEIDTSGQPAVIPPTGTPEDATTLDDTSGGPIVNGVPTTDYLDCCAVGNARGYYCTGTLIAPNVVVTARHCRNVDRVFFGDSISDTSTGIEVGVQQSFSHPDVDLRVLVLERDVAGTGLPGRGPDKAIQPRHIAQRREVGRPSTATLVGFGTVDTAGTRGYGIKRTADVPIESVDSTEPEVEGKGARAGVEMIAGQRGLVTDSCRGDSGGPLYIPDPRSAGELNLLGVTSRGVRGGTMPCGDGGIYVRVDQFIDWIEQVTGVTIPGPAV